MIKDYDMRLHYHLEKANVVADAFSRKSHVNTLIAGGLPQELADDLRELRLEIVPRGYVATLDIQSTLTEKIREAQKTDKGIAEINEKMCNGKAKGFREDEHETLWFEDRIYVPNDPEVRKLILQEAHDSPYSIHPGNTKMYLDFKESFWWTGMKKDIAEYVAVKTTYTSTKLAKIYMTRIVCLHGVPRSIVSDRGTQFTSKFWNQLHETLGTRLEFSTTFHP